MTKAEQYFQNKMKSSSEFKDAYNSVSEQIDIEWELERVKGHIQNNTEKNIIIAELEKLQNYVHNTMFVSNQTALAN